jgi:hypothetical protein
VNAIAYDVLSVVVDVLPIVLVIVPFFALIRHAERSEAPWLIAYRTWRKTAPKIATAPILLAYYLVCGVLLLVGSAIAARVGLRPMYPSPVILVAWAVLYSIMMTIYQTWVVTKTEKGIVQDWLDWPEFEDKDLGVVR